MEDVPAIDDGEEDVFDLHAFCERDICARRNVGTVRVVNRKVPALAQLFQSLFEITLDHGFCKVVVAPVEQVSDCKPLAGGLGRGPGECDCHVVLFREFLPIEFHLDHRPDRQLE